MIIETASAVSSKAISVTVGKQSFMLSAQAATELYRDLCRALLKVEAVADILSHSAAFAFSVPVSVIRSESRVQNACYARWVVWKILYEKFGQTYQAIGAQFSRDHGSVIHGLKAVSRQIEYDSHLKNKYLAVLSTCESQA